MPENEQNAATETKTPGKIVEAGAPQAGTFILPGFQRNPDPNAGTDGNGEGNQQQQSGEGGDPPPAISEDQVKEFLKGQGVELDETGIAGLKEKLTKPAEQQQQAPPTEEEKQKAEAAFEKRMLDHYIANGGTAEDFVATKQIAAMDLKDISAATIRKELKDAGFKDNQIEAIIKERYYQINPEEIVRDPENETEEEFAERKALLEQKITLGSKKFESKGAHIKANAESALNSLRDAIKTTDLLAAKDAEFSTKVEESAKVLPRKMTIELGKIGDEDISPIEVNVTDEQIAKVTEILKDSAKRNQFFYNQDNSFNLDNVMNLMLRNEVLEAAVKDGFLQGSSREVAKFEKVFPGKTANQIGVGGPNGSQQQGRKGVLVSAGPPQAARP